MHKKKKERGNMLRIYKRTFEEDSPLVAFQTASVHANSLAKLTAENDADQYDTAEKNCQEIRFSIPRSNII